MLALHSCLDLPVDGDGVIGPIVSDSKWLTNVVAVVSNLSLSLRKGVSNEVQRLHGADWESQMVLGNLIGVKRLELWLIGHGVGELTDT